MNQMRNKCIIFVVLIALAGHSHGQVLDPATIDDPCDVPGQTPRPPGRRFSDNLSCPRPDGGLQCFTQAELCNTNPLCDSGTDEGTDLVALDCGGVRSGASGDVFVCTPGENIPISNLCDGVANCTSGDDETSALCENKCLMPYAGGCAILNRFCISSEFDVNCLDCFPGFMPDPNDPVLPCVPIPIMVGFEQDRYSVIENNGPQQVCLEINIAPRSDVVVQIITSSGDAQSGTDFDPLGLVDVMFPTGSQARQCVNIMILEDSLPEPEECFPVSIVAVISGEDVQVDPGQTLVCILDDDFNEFELQINEAREGIPFTQVCVVLITGTLAQQTQVNFDTIDLGSATPDEDYDRFPNPVVFAVNTQPGAQMCTSIAIDDDQLVEMPEIFQVQATSDPSIDFPSGSVAIITIQDNDVAEFRFTQPVYQQAENVSPLVAGLQLVSGILTFPINCPIQTQDSTPLSAEAGFDYQPIFANQLVLVFPAGSVPGDQQPFPVVFIDDNDAEDTETFNLIATEPSSQAVLSPGGDVAIVRILDDDVCEIGFQQAVYNTLEGTAQVVCLIKLNNVVLQTPVSVDVATVAGNKTAGVDYVEFDGIVVFGPGSVQECVVIQTIDDAFDDPNECVQVIAASQNPAALRVVPDRLSTLVCCIDDDDNRFEFEFLVIDVPEQGPAGECCIVFVEGILTRQTQINVERIDIGSAEVGTDVEDFVTNLNFPSGSVPGERRCFATQVINDNQVEAQESYQLSASSTDASVIFTPGRDVKTVNIIEDPTDDVSVCLVPPPLDSVPEGAGFHQECVEIVSPPGRLEKTVSLTLSTSDGTAVDPLDYIGGNSPIVFDPLNQNDPLCVDIQIVDDVICEGDESFSVTLSSTDDCVTIAPGCSGTVIIVDDDVAIVQSTQPSYEVNEGETLHVDIELIGQKGPGRECVVTVSTMDGTALSTVMWRDYFALPTTLLTFDSSNILESVYINVCDDSKCEGDEEFEIRLSTSSPGCTIGTDPIPVTIIDDEIDTHGMGDDPHFSIALPSGELLCYTVQGEHGFSFNLISNKKMVMNAKFVPDARRPEVTWLGSIGIIVQHSNYKGSNDTKLRFVAHEKNIYIGDKVVLGAKNIEKLTFSNGKLTISEAPPSEVFHYPSVYVDLEDVQLQFTVKFTNQHLDIYWHTTGGRLADSHGLIGQFFRKGVEIDEVRKILIMPSKEPIPVMRRPVWSFMEREMPDDDQLCWTAMNPGYQGEGLIDGTYFDYLVNDVLSTDFKFEK